MNNSIKKEFNDAAAWGISTSIDLYDCNPEFIRDADKIKEYVYQLCDLIKVTRFGECQVVHFGEHEKIAGYSMTQLIETSLVSGHFANASNTSYLDVFSCKFYDPETVVKFSKAYFEAKDCHMAYLLRR